MNKGSRQICVRGTLVGESSPSDVLLGATGMVEHIRPASRTSPDIGMSEALIVPTLFDIQVNGAFGIDLQSPTLASEDLFKLSDLLARHAVATWVPTLITAPYDDLLKRCRILGQALQDPRLAAHIPGIHLEGPYISPEDGPRGAHPKAYVRKPDVKEFAKLYEAADGRILYVTIAPEVEGALSFIKTVTSWGITVALGHHAANEDQIRAAVDAGARLCTHLGNGMAPTIHRHHNVLWSQLAEDALVASVIADLEHLPPPVLKTFVRAKGSQRLILTSDIVHIAGLAPGKYSLLGTNVELKPSGRICLSGTDLLAGSSLMLLEGVFRAARVTDLTLKEAFDCASRIPLNFFGIRKNVCVKAGEHADFALVAYDKDHEQTVQILAAFVGGVRVV